MMNEMMSSLKKGAVFSQHANEAQTPRLLTPSNCFTQNLTLSTEVMVTKKELKKKNARGRERSKREKTAKTVKEKVLKRKSCVEKENDK